MSAAPRGGTGPEARDHAAETTGPCATAPRVRLTPLRDVGPGLARRWQALADAALEPNPFAGPDVALPAAEHLPGGADASLLVVEREGDLVFAWPVLVRSRYRHVPLTTVQGWRHPHSFLGTPLLARDRPSETWRAVLDGLRRRASWLVLEDLPVRGEVAAALRAATPRLGRPAQLDGRARPIAYLTEQAHGGPGHAVARQRRRLERLLQAQVTTVDRAARDSLESAVECLLELEAGGWKGHLGTALACDPAHAAFYRQMCRRHGDRDAIALLALEGGGFTAAITCVLLAGDAAFFFKIGHDPRFARASPGVQLITEAVARFRTVPGMTFIDSCGDELSVMVKGQFPDSRTVGTLVVPLRLSAGTLVARMMPSLVQLWRAGRSARAGPPGRDRYGRE